MKKVILTLVLVLISTATGFAQEKDEKNVVLTAGTEFSAELKTTIDLEKVKRGDDFTLELTEDIEANGEKIGRSTELTGRVVRVKKIGKNNQVSEVGLFFDFLKHDGKYLLVKAVVLKAENKAEETNELTFVPSETFSDATIVSRQGKNVRLEKGTVLRLKLTKDLKKPKK